MKSSRFSAPALTSRYGSLRHRRSMSDEHRPLSTQPLLRARYPAASAAVADRQNYAAQRIRADLYSLRSFARPPPARTVIPDFEFRPIIASTMRSRAYRSRRLLSPAHCYIIMPRPIISRAVTSYRPIRRSLDTLRGLSADEGRRAVRAEGSPVPDTSAFTYSASFPRSQLRYRPRRRYCARLGRPALLILPAARRYDGGTTSFPCLRASLRATVDVNFGRISRAHVSSRRVDRAYRLADYVILYRTLFAPPGYWRMVMLSPSRRAAVDAATSSIICFARGRGTPVPRGRPPPRSRYYCPHMLRFAAT